MGPISVDICLFLLQNLLQLLKLLRYLIVKMPLFTVVSLKDMAKLQRVQNNCCLARMMTSHHVILAKLE